VQENAWGLPKARGTTISEVDPNGYYISTAEVLDPNVALFRSDVKLGKHDASIGYHIHGNHDDHFGKLFLNVRVRSDKILCEEPVEAIAFFISAQLRSIKMVENTRYNLGNVSVKFNKSGSLTLTRNFLLTRVIKQEVTLPLSWLSDLSEAAKKVKQQTYEFETLALVNREAIMDVITEMRMYAQGNCKGCREMLSNVHPHTCLSVSGERLDRILRDALLPDDKWPYSQAILEVYKRLKKHALHLKREFRHSMAWNVYHNMRYKIEKLPSYIE
jgi:hypothetical protein